MVVESSDARVVVVEPNAHIRRLIATLLGALAIKDVVEARTTEAAAPLMAAKPVDLLVVDWAGDATDAILFVHRLRRGEFGCPHLPVLALSASTHHAVLERAWEAGVDDVIAKPISAMELIQRAGGLIDGARRRAGLAEAAAAE